jgi:hypothetical protein
MKPREIDMQDYKDYRADQDEEYKEWSGRVYIALAVVFFAIYAVIGTMDYNDQVKQAPSCEVRAAEYGRETVTVCKSQ